MHTFNRKLFHEATDKRTLVIEESLIRSLSRDEEIPYRFQIVDDNDKSYNPVFAHLGVSYSHDGSIIHRIYWPTKDTLDKMPDMSGWGVKIYND